MQDLVEVGVEPMRNISAKDQGILRDFLLHEKCHCEESQAQSVCHIGASTPLLFSQLTEYTRLGYSLYLYVSNQNDKTRIATYTVHGRDSSPPSFHTRTYNLQ